MKLQRFHLSARTRSFLGNFVLCCGLSTAVATSQSDGEEMTLILEEKDAESTSSLPQQGMLHVNVALTKYPIEDGALLTVKFALTSPRAVEADLSITPDHAGDALRAAVGGEMASSEVLEPGGGVATADSDDQQNSVLYTLLFARTASRCPKESRGSCTPIYALSEACPDAGVCRLGFTLERADRAETSPELISAAVSARTGRIRVSAATAQSLATLPPILLQVSFDE